MTKVVKNTWHLFDAKGQTVGRLATRIATLLMGKHKPTYSPNVDMGDTVVVINAAEATFTGKKWEQKVYRKHTGYTGNLKEIPASRWRERYPERVILHAVRGMLPKTMHKLSQLNRLKVFGGQDHTFKHIFPNEPLAAVIDQDDPNFAPTLRFMIADERAEFFWKEKLEHVKPDENGYIDNWTHMKETNPEDYKKLINQTKVKVPGPYFVENIEKFTIDEEALAAKALREEKRKTYLQRRGFYDDRNPDAGKVRATQIPKSKQN